MKFEIALITGSLLGVLIAQSAPAPYENDFQKADLDKVPDEVLRV